MGALLVESITNMKSLISSFVLLLLINTTAFPMFVVGKHTSKGFEPLSDDEELQSEVYQVLMTYQYPMNLVLSEGNYGTLFEPVTNGEQDFIRSKLQEISPDLDIAYISTTLWELYALDVMVRELHEEVVNDNIEALFNKFNAINIQPVLDIMQEPEGTRNEVIKAYQKMNYIPEVRRLYMKINDLILNDLDSPSREAFEEDLKSLSIDISHSLLRSIIDYSHASMLPKLNQKSKWCRDSDSESTKDCPFESNLGSLI